LTGLAAAYPAVTTGAAVQKSKQSLLIGSRLGGQEADMNISTLASLRSTAITTSATSSQTTAQTTEKVYPTPSSLKKVDTRLQSQLDTTSASLSALGKFKASIAETQRTAQGLSGLTSTSTSEEAAKAATSFAASFNAMLAVTKTAASQSSGVGNISRSMTRAMTADFSKITDLRAMGFTKAADGSLSLDMAKFEAAYKENPARAQAVLTKLGQLVDKTATKELGVDSRTNASLDALTSRSAAIKLQQSALIKLSQQMGSMAQTQTSSAGLSAYYNMAGAGIGA
jgi:hypothetical protein